MDASEPDFPSEASSKLSSDSIGEDGRMWVVDNGSSESMYETSSESNLEDDLPETGLNYQSMSESSSDSNLEEDEMDNGTERIQIQESSNPYDIYSKPKKTHVSRFLDIFGDD